MKARVLCLLVAVATACKSVPKSESVIYRGVSREENARAVLAILKCLPQPDCELVGDTLECGPFLWRQLNVPALTNATFYVLPQTVVGGSQDVRWEGRRCENPGQVLALWRAFQEKIPQQSLQTVRTLNKQECRIYNALIHGEIHEPVFIVEGGGHKVLMQLSKGQLTYLDDFRNVVVRD